MKTAKFAPFAILLIATVGASHGTGIDHSAVKPADPLDVKDTITANNGPALTGQERQMEQGTGSADTVIQQAGADESILMQQQQQGAGDSAANPTDSTIAHSEKQFDDGAIGDSALQQQQGTVGDGVGGDQPGAGEIAVKQADDAGTGANGTFT